MSHKIIQNFNLLRKEIVSKNKNVKIIAVTKTFPIETIMPLIEYGHSHFGENKVQEAVSKWQNIKSNYKDIKLHLIGKLQTNKVKYILPLFDYIHSLDNLKLAEKINKEQEKKNFKPQIFVQVNIGNETQKNGINIDQLEIFLSQCKKNFKLNIIGLMCIPPDNDNTEIYFKEMQNLCEKFQLSQLSMGMSNDYNLAIKNGATFVRVGSKIFGNRST
jgi:pyridoxal phosphate enzyme (YggS family)|tara:strand:+ start:1661 stop:2311 length:651 start_codon:yes stop_codon:yes gene_type:complete